MAIGSFEKHPRMSWGFSWIWLLSIAWIAFLWNLGNTGLVDETEPLFAEAARQMTVTDNWITPYFNNETRFDKPPLIYWLMAIGYELIGVNEWAARLPSALSAVFLMGLGFYTLRYFGFSNPRIVRNSFQVGTWLSERQLWLSAWIGSALIALNMETIIWARTGVSDMLLSGCMGGGLFCFFLGYASERTEKQEQKPSLCPNRWYVWFYISIALAVLSKGPVGVVLPGLIIGSFLIYIKKLPEVLREMRIILGTVIFGAIALPWYVLVLLQNGRAYWNSFFGYHNLERFTSVVNGHSAPWYFYFLVVSLGFAPWSVYLPVAIARTRFWQRNFWSEQPRHAQLGLFAFFWFAGIFIFFSIAVTKLPSYVLPLIPAAAILVALFWSEEFNIDPSPKKSGFWLSRIANVILLFSLAAAFILVPSFLGSDPAVANLPELVANSGLPRRGGIIWAIAGVVAILSFKRTKGWYWLSLSNFLGFLACSILVIFPAASLLDEVRQLPLRQISQTVMEVSKPEEELWMIGFGKPSLVFYTRRPVKFFKNPAAVREYLKNSLDSATESSSCLIVSYLEDIEQIPLPPTRYESIDRRGTYELIRAKLPVFPSN